MVRNVHNYHRTKLIEVYESIPGTQRGFSGKKIDHFVVSGVIFVILQLKFGHFSLPDVEISK